MPDHPRAAITGLGAAVPQRVMTNDDFAKFLDTSDEWIAQRTGIRQRRIAGEGETPSSLGTAAAKMALEQAGIAPGDLDLIICATISPDMIFPATACLIQSNLGISGVPAFDISAACSGFIYALTVGSQFIETGRYKRVLVIGAETLSRFSDFTDRTSCILFGDAAGAAVLEATHEEGRGLLYSILQAEGSGWDFIHVPDGGSARPASHETVDRKGHFLKMRGRDVYKFAVEKMQWLLNDCMDHCGLTAADVDMVVPHQVNLRIISSATEKCGFPIEKVYINIDRYGNSSAASIPLAMHEAWAEGKIRRGSRVLLVAFGAGLTWAGGVVRM
ncbi:MAG: beta-ketoacyl-ACP synthase III [Phycisphaerae bacterium]|jgi:3-oxoacyl-[acyl-carrier-protein] synthase-3